MSDKPIQVGDLVQVVRLCCDAYLASRSPIFNVAEINTELLGRCAGCKAALPSGSLANRKSGTWGIPISWLKRIPPLSELDEVIREEGVKA